MKAGKNLARYVTPDVSNARLDRQWNAIAERTRGGTRQRWLLAALGTSAAACAVALFLLWGRPLRSSGVFEGAVVETSGTSAQVLTLADGSRVELSPTTRLEFASVRSDAVRLVLTRGSVDLDVAHVEGRTFIVAAAGVDVVVRGTRFRVSLDADPAPKLTVSVERGRVEARRQGDREVSRPIAAGETWSTAIGRTGADDGAMLASREGDAPPSPAPGSVDPGAEAIEGGPSHAPGAADTGRSAELARKFSTLSKARRFAEAYELLGPDGFARELERADAKRLLELADAARLSGHPRDATAALDKLRRKFRSDPRAGLSALELGRLRMDGLGDPEGALEAFADAITLVPSGTVREDAEARQVQVLDRLGDVARCSRARDAYLARYPNGVHAASIRGRCGGH